MTPLRTHACAHAHTRSCARVMTPQPHPYRDLNLSARQVNATFQVRALAGEGRGPHLRLFLTPQP